MKLGYGGTKEEMQRLLSDAEKISGQKFDLSSYADVVEAIHVIQTEMDITGTTAKEASSTISGSLASMKSAWNNLLPAFVQGGDALDQCISNIISSAKTFAGNIIPAIDGALTNILGRLGSVGESIQKVIDKIKSVASNSQKIQKIKSIFYSLKSVIENVSSVMGKLIENVIDFCTKESTLNVIKGVLDGINNVVGFCKNHFEGLSTAALAVGAAFLSIVGAIKVLNAIMAIQKGIQIASTVASYALAAARGTEVAATTAATAAQLGLNTAVLANPITWIIVAIVAAIAALVAIIVVVVKHWDKIKAAALSCWETIKSVWGTVCEWFNTTIIQPLKTFFTGLWNGIKNITLAAWNGIKNAVITAWNGICSFFSTIANWINTNVIQPIKNYFTNYFYFIVGIFTYIKEFICNIWGAISGWIYTNVIQPIVNFFTGLWNSIVSIVTSVWNSICNIWGMISTWVYTNVIQPIINFFTGLWTSITNIVTSIWTTICSIWGAIASWVNSCVIQPIISFFTGLWTSITNIVTSIKNTICAVWGALTGWVSSNVIEPIKSFFSGLWDSITSAVSSVKEAIVSAFQSAFDKVTEIWEKITGFFSGIWDGIKGIVNKIIGKGKEAVGTSDDVKAKGAKHAWGGLMTTPHWGMVAEDGAEMIIPLSKDKRTRGLSLWNQAGEILGANKSTGVGSNLPYYTPKASETYTTNTDNGDTYSPVFNLTINNNGDDRNLEYKVKEWLREGMDEIARGIARRNPRTREV